MVWYDPFLEKNCEFYMHRKKSGVITIVLLIVVVLTGLVRELEASAPSYIHVV